MNKNKILIVSNIVLLIALITCLILLTKKQSGNDLVKEEVIKLLDEKIKESKSNLSYHFKYYEMIHFVVRDILKDYDSVTNNGKNLTSSEFIKYFNKTTPIHSDTTNRIFHLIKSIHNKNSQDYRLLTKFIEYHFVTEIIKEYGYLNFFWADAMGAEAYSKKDTIKIGEEYSAEIVYSISILNKEQHPFIVLDGDTLIAECGYYTFKEIPKKKGLIKHKGYMICYHPKGGLIKLPLEFEYYVK